MKRWKISWTTGEFKTHSDIFEFEKLSDALRTLGDDVASATAHEVTDRALSVEVDEHVIVDCEDGTEKGKVKEILSIEKIDGCVFVELALFNNEKPHDPPVYVRSDLTKINPA